MTASPTLADLLAVAEDAARAAAQHALQNRHRRKEADRTFAHDVKLRLDVECQEEAERVVRARFPDHGILGEEGSRRGTRSPYTWIIDPLDGTVNFFHGLPLWCSSVAVQLDGESVAGAVSIPVLDEHYAASVESPATCNGEPIRVSDTAMLNEAIVLTGLSKHVQDERFFETFRLLAHRARKLRVRGAAAADICHVAAGFGDAYFETGIYLWDWAAAGLILRRAGGTIETMRPQPDSRTMILCTNQRLHAELRELVQPWIDD